ncbi:hypothetical protein CHS0354_036310 [Potamilus streckersoni]|uniref:Uncharacterized protein n=1 Tax=Potamilus streckersoni TaxID=2493646 RepID=A0AAE0W9P3_9BIVA|nr:hypothetical protein CHS0354_036310 [Potamilus streckersoni]
MTLETSAYLNLCLWVYPPDSTNYHPIRSIFQSISLHDQIAVRHTREKKCIVICDTADIPEDKTNTLTNAYSMLKEQLSFGIRPLVEKKKILIGGRLGGGSILNAEVYKAFDKYGIRQKFNSFYPSLKRDLGQKDLQPVAFRIYPGLQELELRLKELGTRPVCMTVSRTTLYSPLSSTEE